MNVNNFPTIEIEIICGISIEMHREKLIEVVHEFYSNFSILIMAIIVSSLLLGEHSWRFSQPLFKINMIYLKWMPHCVHIRSWEPQ